jgi:hypothetical protein
LGRSARQFHLGNINVPENCAANTSAVAQSDGGINAKRRKPGSITRPQSTGINSGGNVFWPFGIVT